MHLTAFLVPLVATAASALALGPNLAATATNTTTTTTTNTTASSSSGTYLELTSIVTKKGVSAFECWRLKSPFSTSSGAGTSGASTLNINDLANATYTILPPRFEGGVHNAPHAQCVVFLINHPRPRPAQRGCAIQ